MRAREVTAVSASLRVGGLRSCLLISARVLPRQNRGRCGPTEDSGISAPPGPVRGRDGAANAAAPHNGPGLCLRPCSARLVHERVQHSAWEDERSQLPVLHVDIHRSSCNCK